MVKKKKKEHWVEKLIKDKDYHDLNDEQKNEMNDWVDQVIASAETQRIDQKNKRKIKIWVGVISFILFLMVLMVLEG